MIFSGIPFLYFFLPAVILLYAVSPTKLKNAVLLAANIFFYAWGERLLALVFIGSILLGWALGLLIAKFRGKPAARAFLTVSVLADLGLLGYFKYTDFFISNFNSLTGMSVPLLKIALPIGISFYTFQILSYTVDVYRGTVRAQKNLINFALYVSLFPQLIAGPIVRYCDVEEQLSRHTHSVESTADGISRFAVGLGKKVLLANVFGELCTSFRGTSDPSVLFFWLYAASFMLQIYFDFSGYSDMAIGLGKMFGFTFMENFNYPYVSASITEFWRRWHISLGSWFRDYVYIPLGGNRKGIAKQMRNILIVWFLTGFWHGAAWNFIFWGLFYAALLLAEKLWLKKFLDSHKAIGHIYVLFAVLLGFVLFNAADLSQLTDDVSGLLGLKGVPLISAETLYFLRSYGFTIIIGIIGCTPLPKLAVQSLGKKKLPAAVLEIAEPVGVLLLLLAVTAYLVDGSFNPFLYFRF